MELSSAYMDQLFAQGLSYVSGICIRLICDSIPEPLVFHLGPGKPLQSITLTFRSEGLHYNGTRPIITARLCTTQQKSKRKRDNVNSAPDGEPQQGKSKQVKGSKETARAQRRATARLQIQKYHLLKPLNMTTEVCVSNGHCFPPRRVTSNRRLTRSPWVIVVMCSIFSVINVYF